MIDFFGPFSPYLNHPLLTEERTKAEVDLLLEALGLGPGASVLDVGCGFGRHTLELARRGLRVTGIDPSETMIEAARAAADAAGLEVILDVKPGEAVSGDTYHGAIAMFTTLGQVDGSGEDNLGLLNTTAASLRPGARFVIEVPQRDAAVAALVTDDRFGDDTNWTEISRRWDEPTSRVVERFEVGSNGTIRHFDLAYRLFSAKELAHHLGEAGFVDIRIAKTLEGLVDAPAASKGSDVTVDKTSSAIDKTAHTMYAMATTNVGVAASAH